MYRVGFDISALDLKFKSHALRGIGRYVSELKKYYDNVQSPIIKIKTFDHREFKDTGFLNKAIDLLPAGRQTIRQQLVYPFYLGGQKRRFDLLHFPAHMDAPSWSINNYVLTVLDLIPLVMSDIYKAAKVNFRFQFARWLEIRAIKNANLILAISQNTADDVHKILGVPYEKIVVTPLGVDEAFFREVTPDEKLNLKAKFKIPDQRKIVISVGGIDPRKNYVSLIQSFKRLFDYASEKHVELPMLLVVGSIEKDREYPAFRALIEDNDLKEHVIETGYAADVDLQGLYAISDVLFFPSLYEGFGFTPLEAMAAGTPVICSGTSCMPEVLGDAAFFVDTKDYASCAKKLFDLIYQANMKLEMRERGLRRARSFSWSKTGELTLAAYEKMFSDSYDKVSYSR